MYEKLIEQYENLDIDEKNALLVYKSRLFKFINDIDLLLSFQKNYKEEYEKIKKIICSLENNFIRYSIFKNINFNTYELFLKSIKEIEQKLLQLKDKIKLKEDINVYRSLTVLSIENIKSISKSELISTSINVEVTDNFYRYGNGEHVLY